MKTITLPVRSPEGELFPIHELAREYPAMPSKDMDDLVSSLRVDGQVMPIIVWRGAVVDGRSRLSGLAQIESKKFVSHQLDDDLTEGQVRDLVAALNLHRRHLTDDQRAAIAARLVRGDVTDPSGNSAPSVRQAAKKAGVSKSKVQRAKRVADEGGDIDSVAKGDKSLTEAEASLPSAALEVPREIAGMIEFKVPLWVAERTPGMFREDGSIDTVALVGLVQGALDILLDVEISETRVRAV